MREEFNSNLLLYERHLGGLRSDTIFSLLLTVFISAILFHFINFYSLLFFIPALILILIRKDGKILAFTVFSAIFFILRRKHYQITYGMNIHRRGEKLFYIKGRYVFLPVRLRSTSTMGITQKNRSDLHRTISGMLQRISCGMEVVVCSNSNPDVEDSLKKYTNPANVINHNTHYASVYTILKCRESDTNRAIELLSQDYVKIEKSVKSIGLDCEIPSSEELRAILTMKMINFYDGDNSGENLQIKIPVNAGKNFFKFSDENCMGARIVDFRTGPSYLLSQAIDSLNFSYMLSIDIENIDLERSKKILRFLASERGSDIRIMERSSDPRKTRAQRQLDEIKAFMKEIEANGHTLLYSDISVIVHSLDPSSIISMMERTETVMNFMGFDLSRLKNYSIRTLRSLLPMQEKKRRYLTNISSLASILPLFLTDIPRDGFLIGFNSFTEKPERISIFDQNSYNIAITGETGSGKSFFSRVLLDRSIISGEVERALVIDPLHEYDENSFSSSPEIVNLGDGDYLELNNSDGIKQPDSSIIDYISVLAYDMIGNIPSLRERVRMIVTESVNSGIRGTVPVLIHVADSVPEISQYLNYYISRKFRRPFILNGNEKITVIRIPKGNPSSLKSYLFITSLFVHEWMMSVPGKKAVLVDEAHTLFADEVIESLLENLVRNSRHFMTSVIIVTQNFSDLLAGKDETNIVNNTSEFFVFRNKSESDTIRSFFQDLLPSPEYMRTMKGGKGDVYSECLRINNGRCYPIKITS